MILNLCLLLNFLFRLGRFIKHSRECFIGYPNTLKFIKNTRLHVISSNLLLVFGYPKKTLPLLLDILLQYVFIYQQYFEVVVCFRTEVRIIIFQNLVI